MTSIPRRGANGNHQPDGCRDILYVGDDVEIAGRVLEDLDARYGRIQPVGPWQMLHPGGMLGMAEITAAICEYSGLLCHSDGRMFSVRLSDKRVRSIAFLMWRQRAGGGA